MKTTEHPINAIERVIEKRTARGYSDQQLINWLEDLKASTWKNNPSMKNGIDGLIDAIRQTPIK